MTSSTSSSENDPSSPGTPSGVWRVILVTGLLLGLHFVWSASAGGARLAESGAQTSLINAQDVLRNQVELEAVVVGSSQTARLSASFLSETGISAGSLGLDGQSAGAGLEIMEAYDAAPRIVLIEANTLNVRNTSNEESVLGSLNGISSRVSKWVPALRAENRLSSNLYSWAKSEKDGRGEASSGSGSTIQPTDPPNGEAVLGELDDHAISAVTRVDQQIENLLSNGHCVVLYWLPANGRISTDAELATTYLRTRHNLAFFDMRPVADSLTYSDSLHLDIPGARETAHILMNSLEDAKEQVCAG